MDDFDIEVCQQAYKITHFKSWDTYVIHWFWVNDFIPCLWKDKYLDYLNSQGII